MAEEELSCVMPAKGPAKVENDAITDVQGAQSKEKEVRKMLAKVGKPAPDFEANAFFNGGFSTIKLSDFKGQWVALCFYPGDFTFV
jgi:hypothetical protein